jgi:hypothetical protein
MNRSSSDNHQEGTLGADGKHRLMFLVSFLLLVLPATAYVQEQRAAPSLVSRAEREEFLLRATIVSEARLSSDLRKSWRASLDDGKRKHPAVVETSTSQDPSHNDYRFNIAAYELDKTLELGLVSPTVERTVNGRAAAVTWWVDEALMSEVDRRRKALEPPDREGWDKQMQAVLVFDALIANVCRANGPVFYPSPVCDIHAGGILITREWRIWLVEHGRAFGTTRTLDNRQSLTRCDRMLLAKLRLLNKEVLTRTLGKFLTSEQLDALETRRAVIVRHFDELIARKGGRAVLYDLPPRL